MRLKLFLQGIVPAGVRSILGKVARPVFALRYTLPLKFHSVPRFVTPRFFYGYEKLAGPGENANGGIVKVQTLQPFFPNTLQDYNILYLVSSGVPYYAGPLAKATLRAKRKFVWNQNGVGYPGWAPKGWQDLNRRMAEMLHAADYAVYQSRFCKQSADHFLGPREKTSEILYNAVDINHFTPPTSIRNRPLTLLLGGTQMRPYRLSSAFETLAVLRRSQPGTKLLVSGRFTWSPNPRDTQKQVISWLREYGIQEAVEFLGPYSQTEAPAIYHRADILLHTQYNDSCPTVVLEAMASGLPVVYSKSGGTPELVGEEGGIGVPVPVSWDRESTPSAEALAEAVLKVASQRLKWSEGARRRCVEQFDVTKWIARHREIFEGLMA
jgi:glycosyltransferase involved in cell wall biosynthesis